MGDIVRLEPYSSFSHPVPSTASRWLFLGLLTSTYFWHWAPCPIVFELLVTMGGVLFLHPAPFH
ncbi:unnamed protein product [Ectocarpus sp. CCAP 1310/34]|nr:unnamed protein product [Ectocarpus sp. CCAP 1310/34]